jgi:hypothetical protein
MIKKGGTAKAAPLFWCKKTLGSKSGKTQPRIT